MRPILVNIPAFPLMIVVLLVGAGALIRDTVLRKRKGLGPSFPSTTVWALGGAALLVKCIGKYGETNADVFANLKSGSVPIYAYGVMLGTSLVIGWFIAMTLAKKDGIDQQEAGTIYMWTAVWSIIGSRLLYVITNVSEFDSITQVVMVNRGGLVAYGGMIGGFLASVYCCRKRKIPLLLWADVAAPSVVLGTAITRVGCLLFGCDFGARSSLPWAITFPKGSPAWNHHVHDFALAPDALRSFPVHPTQVYESLVGLGLFGLLMLIRKYRAFSGQVFLAWVLGYGIMRPLIEIVRDDDQRGNVGALSTSQFIGLVSVVLGLAMLVQLVRKYRRDPDSLRLWQHVPVKVQPQAKPEPSGGKRRKRG
jgi:phosphatidylglycerol:prolipoprotein diacylglycerol transferase